jgi:hypothetical protein
MLGRVRIVLLPSPLLGPATYRPLAAALTEDGHAASVAPVVGETLASVLDGFALAADGAEVLVAHSNAGRFSATVADEAGARVVYLDAALPEHPPLPGFVALLDSLVEPDGRLPGWTHWWPGAEIDRLLPGSWRAAVEAEQPRLSPDFLLLDPPAPSGWRAQPAGYLAFGVTYRPEMRDAASYGWPVLEHEGHPPQHRADPHGVAAALLGLGQRLTDRA